MATGLAAATAEGILDTLVNGATETWIQLHVGDPGAAGTSNVATETDRLEASFASASGGSVTTDTDLLWESVGGSEDYSHYSAWTAESSGTFRWSGTLDATAIVATNDFRISAGGITLTLNVAA